MEMFNKYKSPLGYAINNNNTDTYGVDHSGFSVRDELAYQIMQLIQVSTLLLVAPVPKKLKIS